MSSLRIARALAAAAIFAAGVPCAYAEPTSGPVTIAQLRPYIGGTGVYVYVNGTGPCGAGLVGAYAIYTLDLSTESGKAAYAAALMAVATGKQVLLEATSTACGTQYPALQSIYIGS